MILRQAMWIALFVGFTGALTATGRPQAQPAKEIPVVLEYVDVPSTLEHAISRAQVIVRARVVDAQLRTRMSPGSSHPTVNTAYTLETVEVLKGDLNLPLPTEVLREGGDLVTDKGTMRYVERGYPVFQLREEYLLFLFWNEYLGTFQTAFGPDAAFRITPDSRLHAVGRGLLSKQQSDRDARDVGRRIRGIVDARRNK
jgi:hypothetical protein